MPVRSRPQPVLESGPISLSSDSENDSHALGAHFAQSMTPPSVRPFAFRKAITGHSRGIRRRQQRSFSTLPRSPSRPYGCCSGVILTQQPRRTLLIRSSQIGTGRISASRRTIRPTRHRTKNPMNSSSTPNNARISRVCDGAAGYRGESTI